MTYQYQQFETALRLLNGRLAIADAPTFHASNCISESSAMSISLNEFKAQVLERLRDLLWRQWSAIGLSGYSSGEETRVIDPEALLLLTLTVARYDARLFDEVLDWLETNGNFVNVQRLQNLLKDPGFQAKAELSAVAERLGQKPAVALKWKKLASQENQGEERPLFIMLDGRPMPTPGDCDEIFRRHGFLRPKVQRRELSQPFPREGMPALLLRLRALFGVNLRCEVLCLLGSVDEAHPSLIASLTGQGQRSTQNTLAEMVRSGAVQVRSSAREKYYALAPDTLDKLLRPTGRTPWVSSVPLFRALEILWIALTDPKRQALDSMMLASEWRRLTKEIKPLLAAAGMGQPLREAASFPGEKYFDVFMEDMTQLLTRI